MIKQCNVGHVLLREKNWKKCVYTMQNKQNVPNKSSEAMTFCVVASHV